MAYIVHTQKELATYDSETEEKYCLERGPGKKKKNTQKGLTGRVQRTRGVFVELDDTYANNEDLDYGKA